MNELLRIGPAARYIGVTTGTLRRWERLGRISCDRIGSRQDRRFRKMDLDVLHDSGARGRSAISSPPRREAPCVRVSGRGDQSSSLVNQERELRDSARGEIVRVYHDIGSGLSESRRGLTCALVGAESGRYDVLRVTHRDRLARFGVSWIERELSILGVHLEVLHDENGDTELLSDFMSPLASFSGRLYGKRGADARRRLVAEVQTQI